MYTLLGTQLNCRTIMTGSLSKLRKFGATLDYYAIYRNIANGKAFHNATDKEFLVEEHNDPYWRNVTMSEAGFVHISECSDKSARALVSTDLLLDAYHDAIWQSARYCVNHGRGNWTYVTQYASGTCCWKSPNGYHYDMITEIMARGCHV